MTPHPFPNTGAKDLIPDARDFNLGSYQPPVAIPETFMQDLSALPVFYQGRYPTCGGHAGAAFDSILQGKTLSPKYLWDQIKLIDGHALEDGTDIRSIMKSLVDTGDCELSVLSNDMESSLEAYSSPAHLTPAVKTNGYQYELQSYAFTFLPTWAQIRQAIYENKTVIAMVKCGDGWYTDKQGNTSWAEKDVLPLRLGNYVCGHFVALHSYDAARVYFRNSWSSDWGKNGDGYFDSSYVPNVIAIATALKLPAHFIFKNDLAQGMSGNDVVQLQKHLKVTPTTGFFGPITLAAVKAYQTKNGVPNTGFVGPLTRAKLNQGL